MHGLTEVPHLEIGFECWLLEIESAKNSETFSDNV